MTKKLPVVNDGGKRPPSAAQVELKVAPVAAAGASRPEFPRRSDVRRGVGLIAGGALLATTGLAYAGGEKQEAATAPKPALGKGSTIDGVAIAKKTPKIMIYRGGGGIGPSSDEYDVAEVEAFLSWKFAKEKLDIVSNYVLEHDSVKITVNGYNPQRNIGYEFFSGNDWDEFSDEVKAKLTAWQTAKKAAILVIDISGTPDASTLSKLTAKFFKDIKKSKPAIGMLPKPAPVEVKPEPPRMLPPPIKPPPPAGTKTPTPTKAPMPKG